MFEEVIPKDRKLCKSYKKSHFSILLLLKRPRSKAASVWNGLLIRFGGGLEDADIKRLKIMSGMRREAVEDDLVINAIVVEISRTVRAVAIHNKKAIYAYTAFFRIEIELFKPFQT